MCSYHTRTHSPHASKTIPQIGRYDWGGWQRQRVAVGSRPWCPVCAGTHRRRSSSRRRRSCGPMWGILLPLASHLLCLSRALCLHHARKQAQWKMFRRLAQKQGCTTLQIKCSFSNWGSVHHQSQEFMQCASCWQRMSANFRNCTLDHYARSFLELYWIERTWKLYKKIIVSQRKLNRSK